VWVCAGATLASFVIALLHFLLEFAVYQTVGIKQAIQPLTIALVSTLWMGAGWNYYTAYAPRAEPTLSEETTVQPAANKEE
jgi:hypothetical protein